MDKARRKTLRQVVNALYKRGVGDTGDVALEDLGSLLDAADALDSCAAGPWVALTERRPETGMAVLYLDRGSVDLVEEWGPASYGYLPLTATHWAEIRRPR